MKVHPTLRLLALVSIAPVLPLSTLAANMPEDFAYGGWSYGRSRAHLDGSQIVHDTLGSGFAASSVSEDARDSGYKLFLGHQFNRYFALEGGYFDLGRFGFNASTVPVGNMNAEVRVRGLNLDMVGQVPLGEQWSALGRLGAAVTRSRDSFSGSGAVTLANTSTSQRDTHLKVGAGLQYAFSPAVLMRGEMERYRAETTPGTVSRVNLYAVSLIFPFGRSETPQPRARAEQPAMMPVAALPAPVPVAVAPVAAPPVPVVVVVNAPPAPPPVVPVPRRVRFSAESLFGFGSAAIRPTGQSALDGLARELNGTQFEHIDVVGHSDRLGTAAHNQLLSEQRAEAVKHYLVTSARLDPMKIQASGRGETQPLVGTADCQANKKGHAPSAALLACLQPDRRVDIEVSGTR
jgi:OmpA-OmpF porin, OOP family